MCGGVEFTWADPNSNASITRRVYFPIPKALIPMMWDGDTRLVQWGKRKEEDLDLDAPIGGWARLESIQQGVWAKHNPQKVYIPVTRWMEKDANRKTHWFDMAPDRYLLGVTIQKADRQIAYVVTTQAAAGWIHPRIPLIVEVKSEKNQQHQTLLTGV